VFAGTLTADGLIVECEHGGLTIVREGRVKKFVPETEAVTYRAGDGVRRGQVARVITERAVFDLTADGLVLIEVAPGIDPHRDVLEQVGLPVRIADELTTMAPDLFRP
jgi:propionate CoA-transferase